MSEAKKCPEGGQGAYPNAGAPGEYQISVGTSELFITNFSRMIVAGSSTRLCVQKGRGVAFPGNLDVT